MSTREVRVCWQPLRSMRFTVYLSPMHIDAYIHKANAHHTYSCGPELTGHAASDVQGFSRNLLSDTTIIAHVKRVVQMTASQMLPAICRGRSAGALRTSHPPLCACGFYRCTRALPDHLFGAGRMQVAFLEDSSRLSDLFMFVKFTQCRSYI
jgi:hypothetical protein